MTLEEIQADWKKNKKNYDNFRKFIQKELELIVAELGIQARIVSRTKEISHTIKKLYKNHGRAQYSDYVQLSDLVGARVICRFKSDTYRVAERIRKNFSEEKFEDKSNILKHDQVGYKSLHFDIKLKKENSPKKLFSFAGEFIGEIQVRTLCEDTWAEIYHDIGYKPLNELPEEVNRQLYCLAGLLEVADDCFAGINDQVLSAKNLDEDTMFRLLESQYRKYFYPDFDKEFSNQNLRILQSVHNFRSYSNFEKKILGFIKEKREDLLRIVGSNKPNEDYIPYLSQPEIFLIFYLVQNHLHDLNKIWEANLNIDDLSNLCLLWGKPLVDFDSE